MENCVFCRIIAGQLPSYTVFEDDSFIGFLDIRPFSLGHVNLIPKGHYRWVDDVPDFAGYFERAHRLSRAIRKALSPETVFYIVQGLEMPHAHIKVVPKYADDDLGEKMVPMAVPPGGRVMAETAEKIKAALAK